MGLSRNTLSMNIITYNLMYLFQRKSYEAVKKYKVRVGTLSEKVKRLTSENQSLKEMIEVNDKRHREDMLDIRFQLEEVNNNLPGLQHKSKISTTQSG